MGLCPTVKDSSFMPALVIGAMLLFPFVVVFYKDTG